MKTLSTALLCLLFLTQTTFTQSLPGLLFGGSDNDFGYALCQTNQGDYLLAGTTRSFGVGSEDIYVIQLNENGNLNWSRTYGGPHPDFARSVIAIDNGFIIAGDVWDGGNPRTGMYLCYINQDGNKIWEKQYGTSMDEKCFKVIQLTSGGFMLLGYSRGFDVRGDIFLVKTDVNGEEIWHQNYGFDYDDYAMDIIENDDGSIMIIGTKDGFFNDVHANFITHDADILILKLDENGEEIWQKLYGLDEHDFGYAIRKDPVGGFYIFGSTQSYGAGSFDMYLSKINENGIEEWYQTYGGQAYEYGISMDINNNGDLFLFGSTKSYGQNGSADFYLLKVDAYGNNIWELTIGGDLVDFGQGVIATADSGCVVIGSSESYRPDKYNILLVKVNKFGQIEHLVNGLDSLFEEQVVIAPNPVRDKGRILLNTNNSGFTRILEFTSVNGSFTRKYTITGPDFTFDASSLPAGIYAYKLYAVDQNTPIYRGKLIVY